MGVEEKIISFPIEGEADAREGYKENLD